MSNINNYNPTPTFFGIGEPANSAAIPSFGNLFWWHIPPTDDAP